MISENFGSIVKSDLEIRNKLSENLKDISGMGESYCNDFFGHTLSLDEANEARILLAKIRTAVLNFQKNWKELIWLLPKNNEIERTIKFINMRDSSKLIEDLLVFITVGYEALNVISLAVVYFSHYHNQCNILSERDNNIKEKVYDSLDLLDTIEQIVNSLQTDVDSRKAQIEILNLSSQTQLTKQVHSLTRISVKMTIALIVLTVIAAGTAVYSLIFSLFN